MTPIPTGKAFIIQGLRILERAAVFHFPYQTIDKDTQLDCDVVIIGSGAGGSVVAAELADVGQSVIVLEKGPYVQAVDMTQREEEMLRQLYEARAALATTDGNMGVLAGSCLGGGTTINWAGAFRTPDFVLEEWAKEHGNPHFLTKAFQESFDKIEQRCHINTRLIRHNPQNESLQKGAQQLGYLIKTIPRNVRQPEVVDASTFWKMQGFSPHGNRLGIKQGAVQTFLKDAVQAGALLYPDTVVDRIVVKQGFAQGVIARHTATSGQEYNLTIRAKRVVVAAGAIHTPAVLKRSGITHPEIGHNLYLHPTSAVSARYPHKIESWYGPMMSAVCDEFVQLNGNYGFKLETPPGASRPDGHRIKLALW